LETRADTLVFRLNWAYSSGEARQLVNHKNFIINGQAVSFATENIDMFDVFSAKNKSFFYDKSVKLFKQGVVIFSIPAYLEVNFRIMSAVIYRWPVPSQISYTRRIDGKLLISSGPKDGR
jgi:small subunit ribosomal protein S4